MKATLEIIASNLDHVIQAQQSGAHRIELCAALSADGITPSHGLVQSAVTHSKLPVMVMIRPREGDFQYSDLEIEAMSHDIAWAKKCGAMGIVIGILDANQNVRKEVLKRWVQEAYPMEVTFHRAFDITPDPFRALEDIIACGCTRILTSGQQPSCITGKELINELQVIAGDRITIMAGAGINAHTIGNIMSNGIYEYHMSGHQRGDVKNNAAKMFGSAPLLNVSEIQQVVTALSTLAWEKRE